MSGTRPEQCPPQDSLCVGNLPFEQESSPSHRSLPATPRMVCACVDLVRLVMETGPVRLLIPSVPQKHAANQITNLGGVFLVLVMLRVSTCGTLPVQQPVNKARGRGHMASQKGFFVLVVVIALSDLRLLGLKLSLEFQVTWLTHKPSPNVIRPGAKSGKW